jgi:ion channel-forming bestrophin family protein
VIILQIRNLARFFWISVALPPTTEQPLHIKGKTPTTDLTHPQLHRRKVDSLKLALSFAFAVKHYLRGEDGMDWEDYADIFPTSFYHHWDPIYASQRTSIPPSYAAMTSPGNPSKAPVLDATKRVRPKRHSPGITTPLLDSQHHHASGPPPEPLTLPLPLMFVLLFYGT